MIRRYTEPERSARKVHDDAGHLGDDRVVYRENDLVHGNYEETTTADEVSEEREENTRVGKLFGFGRPGSEHR